MYQFSGKTDNFEFLGQSLAKNRFLGLKFQKSKSGFGISIHEILCVPISDKKGNFEFLGPNLPIKGFWGRIFKNLSMDSDSTTPIYHVCQLSFKMDIFYFFGLNLGKLPNYVQYFSTNIVEGVAES